MIFRIFFYCNIPLTNTVFCYFNLNGQHDCVLSEIKRVLKDDGLTVYEGMNWDWEYKVSPY